MDHDDIRHKLSELIDDAVTPEEKEAIERHLASCSACSEALQELRRTVEHLHAVPEIEPPAGMTQKIMDRVSESEQRRNFLRTFLDRLVILRPIRAVAVLFLAVTAYYIYMNIDPAAKYRGPVQEETALPDTVTTGRADDRQRSGGKERKAEPPAAGPQKEEAGIRARREPPVAQAPEYRSLDMKYAYEKPAPPEPAEAAPPSASVQLAPSPGAASKRSIAEESAADAEAHQSRSLAAPAAPRSAGRAESALPEQERAGARADKARERYEPSYDDFLRDAGAFPYNAPPDKLQRVLRNYSALTPGMSKSAVRSLIGPPDYAVPSDALDPPYRSAGTCWVYVFFRQQPAAEDPRHDRLLKVYFSSGEEASLFAPQNQPELTTRGTPSAPHE